MATRQYNFIVGPETSTTPSGAAPTAADDLMTLDYAQNRFNAGRLPVADIAALKALSDSGTYPRQGGELVSVESTNTLYLFDEDSVEVGDDNNVVQPNSGSGRWLKVAQTATAAAASGADGSIQFATSASLNSDNSNFFWDNANKRLGIGTNAPTGPFMLVQNTSADRGMRAYQYSNDSSSQLLLLAKARGTSGTPLTVQNGDSIFTVANNVHDGTSFLNTATIFSQVNGTVSTGSVPTDLIFSTGSSSATERMRITSSGAVGIGNSAPAVNLHVGAAATAVRTRVRIQGGSGGVTEGVVLDFLNNATTIATLGNSSAILGGADNSDFLFYIGTATNYRLYVNAAEQMRVTSSGTVGIGTSSVTAKTHIAYSDTSTNRVFGQSANTTFQLQNTSATNGNYTAIVNRDSASSLNSQICFVNDSHSSQGSIEFIVRDGVTLLTGFNISRTGRLFASAIHNNSAGATGTSPMIASGGYTPTTFSFGGSISSVNSYSGFKYMRVGNVVTESGSISVTSSSTALGNVVFSQYVPSSFTGANDATGSAHEFFVNNGPVGGILADEVNDKIVVRISPPSAATFTVYVHFTYIVQ